MFNAEDIIELEKKWFNYKVKQTIKLYVSILLITMILAFSVYTLVTSEKIDMPMQTISKDKNKQSEIKKIEPANKIMPLLSESNYSAKNINTITLPIESNKTKNIITVLPTIVIKKDNSKPYHFKLEPTEQGSELFSSNGFLTLNLKYSDKKQDIIIERTTQIVQPLREIETNIPKEITEKKKAKISIDMQEIDTITYLKDKYYSTSSIVFALMLSEEYYYEKKYKEALKWSLTANDIDSQNTKSWYWFAKSKVKLNQKKDAIRALEAYLSNNSSKRLSTLLHKIELGDTDD